MSLRWKLLLLLLAIALVPLVTVTVLANRATLRLGATVGDQARRTLTELTRRHLEQLVADKAAIIGREGNLVNLALQLQAREVERCLAVETPPDRLVYMAEDFDGELPPPDLALSTRHFRRMSPGNYLPIPISSSEPVFKLAPGLMQYPVRQDMLRLALALPTCRTIQERYSDLIFWQSISLETGLHSSYPGHGGFPLDYDPRQRRWYVRAKTAGEVVWTLPYTDVTSRRSVLTASMPVYRPDGSLAGVTAIDVTVSGLLERARLPHFGSSVAKVVTLDPHDEWDANTPREIDLDAYTPEQLGMLVVAQPDERESEGLWQSPTDRSWFELDDPAEHASLIRDLYDGRSSVRQIDYQGQSTLCAYSPIWGRQAFLVVLAPYNEVVADAARARESILSLTRSQLRLTVATLGVMAVVVLAIALRGSRTVTRPVSELVEGAQRVAAGDFDARVDVRTHDELGELGRAFNAMVPQLEDRIRIRQSLVLAMEVQQNLLPAKSPKFEGLDVAGRSLYCDETGGDYYDFLDLSEVSPRELGVAVGDVTGHGVAAALLMTTARALLRSRAGQQTRLSELMRDVNRLLSQDTPIGRYMTLFYAVIDAERRCVRWVNAGHDPAITFDPATGKFGQLDGGDLPLGVEPDETYEEFHCDDLTPGQVIVIGTDGIWEARNWRGEHFGKDAVRQLIRAHAAESAEQICRAITDDLDRYRTGCPQEDDVTLVVVKIA
jgi:sigma-B regulation protein RsbU (phosphoserine phosphatase)